MDYASRSDVFSLWFLGDLHLGAAACDEKAVSQTVEKIRVDPNAIWVGLGDLAEAIPRTDSKRFKSSQIAPWLYGLDDIMHPQVVHVAEMFAPIKDKCLGLVTGNHEGKVLSYWERDLHQEICAKMGARNLTDEALITLRFRRAGGKGDFPLKMYVHHGIFAARKTNASRLLDLLMYWDVRIAAVGHGHKREVAPPLLTGGQDRRGRFVTTRRYALMCGAFRKEHQIGTGTYASERMYPLADIGPVVVKYQPDADFLMAEI